MGNSVNTEGVGLVRQWTGDKRVQCEQGKGRGKASVAGQSTRGGQRDSSEQLSGTVEGARPRELSSLSLGPLQGGRAVAPGSQTAPALGALPCLAAAAAPGSPPGPRERVPMRNKPINQHTAPGWCLGCGP